MGAHGYLQVICALEQFFGRFLNLGVALDTNTCYHPALRFGTWRSLVARTVRDREAAGSNPVVPTMKSQVRGVIPLTFFFVYGHKLATSGHKQRA